MPVLSRVTCFPIAILSMNISAQNARKPSLMEKKTWLYRNPFFSFEHIHDKRQRSKSKISCTLYLLPFSFAGYLSFGREIGKNTWEIQHPPGTTIPKHPDGTYILEGTNYAYSLSVCDLPLYRWIAATTGPSLPSTFT